MSITLAICRYVYSWVSKKDRKERLKGVNAASQFEADIKFSETRQAANSREWKLVNVIFIAVETYIILFYFNAISLLNYEQPTNQTTKEEVADKEQTSSIAQDSTVFLHEVQ